MNLFFRRKDVSSSRRLNNDDERGRRKVLSDFLRHRIMNFTTIYIKSNIDEYD